MASMALSTSNTSEPISTAGFHFSARRSSFSYPPSIRSIRPGFCSFTWVSILDAIIGTNVIATIKLAIREKAMVSAIS